MRLMTHCGAGGYEPPAATTLVLRSVFLLATRRRVAAACAACPWVADTLRCGGLRAPRCSHTSAAQCLPSALLVSTEPSSVTNPKPRFVFPAPITNPTTRSVFRDVRRHAAALRRCGVATSPE